jgi:NAD-dependent deacetylase
MDAVVVDGGLPDTQPRCSICGSPARPDAVLFTKCLPEDAWAKAEVAVRILREGDVLLVIGTSGVVQPATSLPGLSRRGVIKIEINTECSGHTADMDIFVPFPSAEAIPQLLRLAEEQKADTS